MPSSGDETSTICSELAELRIVVGQLYTRLQILETNSIQLKEENLYLAQQFDLLLNSPNNTALFPYVILDKIETNSPNKLNISTPITSL